jgi:hypothetical protein
MVRYNETSRDLFEMNLIKQTSLKSLFLVLFFLTCEHFHGRLLDPKTLILVPGLEGRWHVSQEGKETSRVRIKFERETRSYLLEIEGDLDRSLLRFTKIEGKYIGEYHDVSETGEEIPSGHIILLSPLDSGWRVYLGSDISKSMVTKYKLIASPHKKYGTNPPSYYLNGNQEENLRSLGKLIADPEFFQIADTKKIIYLKNADISSGKQNQVLEDFLKTFGKETKANVTEFDMYYEIIISRESGGAEKYKLDKKTGSSTMIWHEHPDR